MSDLMLYAILGVLVAIVGWLIFLTAKYREILRRAGIIFEEEPHGNLKEIIQKYMKGVKMVEDHCQNIDEESKKIRDMAAKGLHKIGFVRYNPFGNVGSDQSFSLCLLDEQESGLVISSIHSREGTRVYAKTVYKGESTYNLSEEEKKAIFYAKGKKAEKIEVAGKEKNV